MTVFKNSETSGADAARPGAKLVQDKFHLPDLCTVQSLLFIVLAGALLSIVFTLANSQLRHFNWYNFSLIAFFILWVILLNVAVLCQLRPVITRQSLLKGSLISYGLIVTVTLLVSLMAQWLEVFLLGQENGVDYWLVTNQVLIAAILAGVSLRYLYLQEQLHIQQQSELASRIQALQSRIRPHFLFNSMNIIASLIETEPKLAERVVEDLSVLFRATLSDANQLVPVKSELDLAKNYLHIEGLRLGDRLKIDWQLDELEPNWVIPHLSIQPLVENAIYHGIQPLAQGGTITVSIKRRDGKIAVQIRNPVPEDALVATNKDSERKGNSLALENLQRRLAAYYGDEASFSAGKQANEFAVEFICPPNAIRQERL